jgi:hypothetical protein
MLPKFAFRGKFVELKALSQSAVKKDPLALVSKGRVVATGYPALAVEYA